MKSDNVKSGMQQAPHRSLFNALGFTEEEAQDFVNKTVGATLYNGVSLDGVNR